MPEVATLLAASRAAHDQYRHLSAASHGRNRLGSAAAIRKALLLRADAEALDPQRTDPAWILDAQAMKQRSHDSLVAFYVRYLSPNEAYAVSA